MPIRARLVESAKFFLRPIHQSYFVVILCVGIIGGVVASVVFQINYFISPIWLIVSFVLLLITYIRPHLAFAVLALIAGMLISFHRVAAELQSEKTIEGLIGQTVIVTGTVSSDPIVDDGVVKFKLTNLRFGESRELKVSSNLYIVAADKNQLSKSDEITMKGGLNAGFGTYSGTMFRPVVLEVSRTSSSDWVLSTRNWFASRITSLIPEPESNLGLSYLLGMKTGLPDDLNEHLRAVGLTHIVVASGTHLSILVEIARRVFGKISRTMGLVFSIIFITFFMAMIGFTPSIMRAGLMSILSLLAWYVGRSFSPWRIIILVAATTLFINPMYIIDLGWQLSFASFTGIMVLGPRFGRFLYGNRKPGAISGVIITTISATLMTLPITLYYFGSVSLISVLANLLILPTLPIAMGLAFFTGIVAEIPFFGGILAFLATKLLDFHIFVVNSFAEAKSLLITIEPYNPWLFLLYLVILAFIIIALLLERRRHCHSLPQAKLDS